MTYNVFGGTLNLTQQQQPSGLTWYAMDLHMFPAWCGSNSNVCRI